MNGVYNYTTHNLIIIYEQLSTYFKLYFNSFFWDCFMAKSMSEMLIPVEQVGQ